MDDDQWQYYLSRADDERLDAAQGTCLGSVLGLAMWGILIGLTAFAIWVGIHRGG